MKIKRRRGGKKTFSQKDRFMELSGTFGAFARLFQTSVAETLLQVERDAVMDKVCTGLSEVCRMLAEAERR